MTKKSFLTLVLVLVLVFMFWGCGNDKHKEESEKNDTGDTEAVSDTEQIDTGDTEAVMDEEPTETDDTEAVMDEEPTDTEAVMDEEPTDTEAVMDEEPTDTDDTEAVPDDDNNENDPHGECTTSESYGENFLTRNYVSEICSEKIAGAECYGQATPDNVEYLVEKLHKYEFVFNREDCSDLNEKDESGNNKLIPCPDFIPEKFKLSQLAGCEIYTVLPEFDCIASCPDIYFLTDNNYFEKVVYSNYYELPDDKMKLHSLSTDGKVSFSSIYHAYDNSRRTTFIWSEKAEDGTEIEKGVRVYMEIADSSVVEDELVPNTNADVEMNDEDAE